MTDNERIARFMGWTGQTAKACTTDYNLFVAAWNKAVDGLCANSKEAKGLGLFSSLDDLHWKFTIEERLLVLLRIIKFLTEIKK